MINQTCFISNQNCLINHGAETIYKGVLFLHVAVMLFGFSGVLAQYVQVPAVLVAMGQVICSSLLLLAGVYITVPEFSVENQVTVGILWGMLCSFTYAIMTQGNRYFSKKYTGRIICLHEQGTAAIVLLPALWLVKVEWYQNDLRAACMIPESQLHFREMHLQCGQWFGNAADR